MIKIGVKTFCACIFLYILILFSGCRDLCEPDSSPGCKPIHFNDGWYDHGVEGDDTRVLDYRIDGQCLYLTVGYGGGCKEHDIQFAANGWIKTYPPQITAKIVHDDQDSCEAYIQEEVGFDLGSLEYQSGFYINIKGFDEQIFYKYSK